MTHQTIEIKIEFLSRRNSEENNNTCKLSSNGACLVGHFFVHRPLFRIEHEFESYAVLAKDKL